MNIVTRKLARTDGKGHTIRWGTATLGQESKIQLFIGTLSSEPMLVCLTHRLVIGRSETNESEVDINLSAYEAAEKGVSRRHAALEIVNKVLMLSDLNSRNGTFLNGQRLMPDQQRVLRDGDHLLLGELLMHIFYARPNP